MPAPGALALPANAGTLAPSVSFPGPAVRLRVVSLPAPRVPYRARRSTVGAPAPTAPPPAGLLTFPSVLALAVRSVAPALPSVAGTPAPDVAVLPPSARLYAEWQGAARVLPQGLV